MISGWSDGKIRAFGPQSGKLLYTINEAHQKAVTAIACTSDSSRVISGGEEGLVRVWRIEKSSQPLEASMKDHRGAVNCIRIRQAGAWHAHTLLLRVERTCGWRRLVKLQGPPP